MQLRPCAVVAAISAILSGTPGIALADGHGGYAELKKKELSSTASATADDSPSSTGDEHEGASVIDVEPAILTQIDRPPIRILGDIVQSTCSAGEGRVEVFWVDPDTGEVTSYEGYQCVPYSEIENDRDDTAPPPASAHAPARDSVAEAIPDRAVQLNPFPRGMTGMDTWYWYDDDGDADTAPTAELSVTASVPGIAVTSTAAITSYCWDVDGDGADEVCTDSPGSEQQPAFTHVYESTGAYQVRLTVTWGGSFSVNGAPPVAFDPVQRTYTVDYEVIEVRSVLTG